MKYIQSIRFKLMLLSAIPLLIIALIYIGISFFVSNRLVAENTLSFVDSAEFTVNNIVEDWRSSTLGFAKMTVESLSDDLMQAILDKDAAKIAALAKATFESTNCDGMTFADMEGNALARVTNPAKFGDNIKSSAAIADAMNGLSVSYAYPTTNNGFSVASGVPIYDDDNTQIAVLFLSKRLDKDAFMKQLSDMSRCDIDLYQHDVLVSSSWREVDPETAEKLDESTWNTILANKTVDKTTNIDCSKVMMRYIPVIGRNGAVVGAIRAIFTFPNSTWVTILWIIVFVVSAAVLLPVISLNVARLSKSIRLLSDTAEKMALGEIDISVKHNRTDELGVLQKSFIRLIGATKRQSEVIEKLAQGDLTTNYSPRSPQDSIGNNLVLLIENNREVIANIANAASQVTSAAHHVADGSQSLASGTAEQSSAIQTISAEMSDIGNKNLESTQLAGNAAEVSNHSQELMVQSISSMTDLVKAMEEITSASASISGVIKVIDDIAFQTNILALNASVEAARAGQHGKGFAVVASEVRNLAAKSASATSETTAIIEKNMSKVKYGSEVVQVANKYLAQLSENAQKINVIISDIANSTGTQNKSLSYIEASLNSVVNVIQTNSETAEASASASREMSEQASVLDSLISKYKLSDKPQLSSSEKLYLD